MATLIGQLPVWIGATLATWAICWSVIAPEACQDVPACSKHLKTYPGRALGNPITLFRGFNVLVRNGASVADLRHSTL